MRHMRDASRMLSSSVIADGIVTVRRWREDEREVGGRWRKRMKSKSKGKKMRMLGAAAVASPNRMTRAPTTAAVCMDPHRGKL